MMAQTITCDICNAEPASVLQTDIATGEVLSVGSACHFPFYIGVAGAIAATMTDDIKAEYAEAVAALAAKFTGPPAGVDGEGTPVTGGDAPVLADVACLADVAAFGACVLPKGHDGHHADAGGHAFTDDGPVPPARQARARARTPR